MIHPEPDFESNVIFSTNGSPKNRSAEPDQVEMFSRTTGKTSARAKPKPLDGLKAPSLVGKNFVLDTNVLLHDPQCLRRFGDNHICIPLEVLCELDRFKAEQTERGANARTVHRTLTELFAAHPGETSCGIPTHDGGSIRFVTCASNDRRVVAARERLSQLLPETDSADHRILLCAHVVDKVNAAPVVLVTKDLNMQLKALALGIPCEDYSSDKVDESSIDEHRMRVIAVVPHELQRFASAKQIHLVDLPQDLAINEYVLLQVANDRSMPARYKGAGNFVRLRSPETICIQKGTPISPLNTGQECFLDALLDPTISLVTCYGQAGTGKTLLAVAAALHLTLNGGQYTGVTVSRPIVALGETLGFLPGSLEEKLNPWLQPIFDALEFILAKPQLPEHEGKRPQQPQPQKPKAKNARKAAAAAVQPPVHGPVAKSYQRFLDNGIIEVEALCYIRGRSIPKRFFILDVAQQLTPLVAKTIVTRMAQGSKLILVGDPAQIDNAYVDRRSNGLVYTREKLKNQACSAHITLERGERSPLAEAGARLM